MGERQMSPMTPSANLPVTPDSNLVVSPQVGAARQDSQLSSSSQSMDQDSQHFSRQNSTVPVARSSTDSSVSKQSDERASPLHVESILGIKDDQPIDPPLSNSMRDAAPGGGGSGSNINSPHTQSPMGGMLTPNVVVGMEDGQSPAPGRPELLGFPAKSPSFRTTENQPSPLAEDGKSVSGLH